MEVPDPKVFDLCRYAGWNLCTKSSVLKSVQRKKNYGNFIQFYKHVDVSTFYFHLFNGFQYIYIL